MYILPLGPSDPQLLFRRLSGRPGRTWLSGHGAGNEDGRWTFVGAEPDAVIERAWDALEPWEALQEAEQRVDMAPADRAAAIEGAPPTERIPHWIGYLAYEGIDDAGWPRGPRPLTAAPMPNPTLHFARYPALFAIDHRLNLSFVVGDDAAACTALVRATQVASPALTGRVGTLDSCPASSHQRAIESAREAIARGDVYQVNLARRWHGAYDGDPAALWERMLRRSPVPLGMYYQTPHHTVLACTMERFLRWDRSQQTLHTRPIKGTVARRGGRDASEASWLRANLKEQSEHAMIVDLMRNDLGRIAEVGSVQVKEHMQVEPYAGLSHLVSTIACRTPAATRVQDVLAATFPPGSVTGTPKLSAVQLIRKLERCPRGIYTGAVGHIDRSGGLSLAVAIRTAVVGDRQVQYHAGGGIVWDSDSAREVAETELKAQVFLQAAADLDAT